jgi:hypothetical protein
VSVDAPRGGKGVSANAEESEGTVREKQKSLSTPWIHQKKFQRRRPKEEDVKEERETSPRSSSISSRIVETEEVKGLQDWRSRQPEDMFHNAPWQQGQGKGKGYGRKRDERELLLFGSTGGEPDIQGFHKHVVVIFDAGAAVSTVPRKDFEGYISGEPRTTKYKTASGELLENHDHGQVKLYGTDQDYEDKSMTARVTDVHKILASGSEVCKKNLVVLDSNGGTDNPG